MWENTNNFQPADESYRVSSCPAASGSRQQQVSWCGLSFPALAPVCRSVGKKQCERGERKCVFICVGGARFPLWSVATPLPGLLCDEPGGHCVSQRVKYLGFFAKNDLSILWNRSRKSKNLLSDYWNGLNDKTDLARSWWVWNDDHEERIYRRGYDIMGFGLLCSSPSSFHLHILVTEQTSFYFRSSFSEERLIK